MDTGNYSATSNNMKLVHYHGLLHLVQCGEDWRGRSPPRPLFAVPNVTAHPSATSVYQSPYCCNVGCCSAVLTCPSTVKELVAICYRVCMHMQKHMLAAFELCYVIKHNLFATKKNFRNLTYPPVHSATAIILRILYVY